MHDTKQSWWPLWGMGWEAGPSLPWRLLAPQQISAFLGLGVSTCKMRLLNSVIS